MIALIVLLALAMFMGVIAGLLAATVAVVRAAGAARQRGRARRNSYSGPPIATSGLGEDEAEFQRIISTEWPTGKRTIR